MENTPDLGSIISTLSSNPALMTMISELMKNSTQPRQSEPAPPPPPPAQTPSGASENAVNLGNMGLNPELIGTLTTLLSQNVTGGQQKPPEPQPTKKSTAEAPRDNGENALSKLLGGRSESENRLRLLNALRPYLSEDRREKLDLILKLLQLTELGQLSGLLKSL